jgi:hypothetical protein
MADGTEPLCFTCGLPGAKTLQLNRLPNGQVCPACRDRLLASIAPALPNRVPGVVAEFGAGTDLHEEVEAERERDGETRPWPPPGMAS